jgi:zinc transport system permease protein
MSIGLILVYLTPGYAPDLMSYLFGNILMVQSRDLIMMAGLDILIVLLIMICYHELLALCFDEEYMRVSGRNSNMYYFLLLCMVAVSTVIMVRVTGIILNITLLTIPAIISHKFVSSLKTMLAFSVIQGIVYVLSGLWLSYIWNLPSGATIVMIMTTIYGR